MPVLVACSCGKQLKVPDEAVGRNVRCPVCKSVILATPSALHTHRNTAAANTDTMVRFNCGTCGKEMQALAEYGGQETACPQCAGPVLIPGRPASTTMAPLVPSADDPAMALFGDAPVRKLRVARGRRVWPWVAAALLLLAGGGFAGWFFFLRAAVPTDLALVPADAQVLVSVRVRDVWKTEPLIRFRNERQDVSRALSHLESDLGLAAEDYERVTLVIKDVDAAFRLEGKEKEAAWWVICLTAADRPYNKKKLLEKLVPGASEVSYQNRKYQASDRADATALYFHSERIFVFGPKEGIQQCLDHLASPKSDGPQRAAIREIAAAQHNLVACYVPSGGTMERLRKGIPAAVEPFAALFEARALTVKADLRSALEVELALAFVDPAKAGAAATALQALSRMAKEKLEEVRKAGKGPAAEAIAKTEAMLSSATVDQQADTVVIQFKSDAVPIASLSQAMQNLREAILPDESETNLKKLAAAMKAYHDKNGRFPPTANYVAGKPMLSWRVHLLPYLGEESLFKEFKQNEPWDGPNNKRLLASMPLVYRMPGQPTKAFQTYFQVFDGNAAPFFRERQLGEIKDGADKTIAIAEAATSVEWTKPADIGFDPNNMVLVLNRLHTPAFKVVMFDGSVYTYERPLDITRLKALITHAGGEKVEP